MHTGPGRDADAEPDEPLDPMLREPPWENNRAIVDACRPFEWRDDFPTVAEANPELKESVRRKWPHLYEG